MARPLALALLLAPLAGLAQTPPDDGLPPLPTWRPGHEGAFQPLHDSEALAYLYSAAAIAGLVVLGVATNEVLEAIDPEAFQDDGRDIAGYIAMGTGLMIGPSVGLWTLGGTEALGRSWRVRAIGTGVASGLVVVGVLLLARSAATFDETGADLFFPLTYVAGGVLAVSAIAGGAMDIQAIPQSARRAQRRLRADVSAGFTPSGPGLALRVGL